MDHVFADFSYRKISVCDWFRQKSNFLSCLEVGYIHFPGKKRSTIYQQINHDGLC
jgi:hypothetical protein